ncbi:Cyclic di-GMP phosphodiesterase response regulator RpfG [bacterium HR29]|jgi:putative nucleotidyltransferase with HDIG domain|nr:Cyclic di-GMP phosphodiesterase response regulator RpfG [bacterium HR29]
MGRYGNRAFSRVMSLVAAALGVVPLLLLAVLSSWREADLRVAAPAFHFYAVSATCAAAVAVSTAIIVAVRSARDPRNAFIAAGFLGLAGIFLAHGLSTPGFLVESYGDPHAVLLSAPLSLLAAGVAVGAAVLPERSALWRGLSRRSGWALALYAAAVGGYFAVAMLEPTWLGRIPRTRVADWGVGALVMALLGWAAWRYWRAWRLTETTGQLAMTLGLLLLAESQLAMLIGSLWELRWWTYHALMLAAFAAVALGWAMEGWERRSLAIVPRALALRERLDALVIPDAAALEELEEAIGVKDAYTRNHMSRVASLARALAQELGLPPRSVAIAETAGRIHDIGKLVVPDRILLKPGPLTPEEFERVKHHTVRGEQIALQSRALADVARVVRAHHERYDGRGYPDGLAGEEIPIEARVVAVADTFDALTSSRAYRPARPLGEAVEELRRVAGTQLDPRCVDAFLRWLAREEARSALAA